MKQEIDPKDTSRAQAFELWMKAPNPMVTFFKTVDVTPESIDNQTPKAQNLVLGFIIVL